MSAQAHESRPDESRSAEETTGGNEAVVAGTPVVVRRRAGLAALIGAGASAVGIGYLWRASQTMAPVDWSLCALMTVIAAYYLAMFVDARTPLLVADDLGVRIRLGKDWRGLPWDAVNQVLVRPRHGVLQDGRIAFSPYSLGRALDGVDGRGKRHAALNQKMYGAALAVPLGITTRVSGQGEGGIVDELAALSLGRAEVVDLAPVAEPEADRASEPAPERETEPAPAEPVVELDETPGAEEADSEPQREHAPRRTLLGGIGTIVSRVGKGARNDVDTEDEAATPSVPPAPAAFVGNGSTAPLRVTTHGLRAEVVRDLPASLGNTALAQQPEGDDGRGDLPEARSLRRSGSVDLVFDKLPDPNQRVRPISTLGDPVEPLVIDDFVTEPAYDPVIGPELAASRNRLGLSVDELADRTRIRPHVIESIEVDDFAPCGGDFYARGHLRTLARVLGRDAGPLLESFEDRYATAPINARRVFEAELATGMTGSMRSTIGGPNWSLLIGVVLALVLVWGVARLFSSEPAELVQQPGPVLNGSAGIEQTFPKNGPEPGNPAPALETPIPVMLTAAFADTSVVVRNGAGRIVFSGEMVLGEKKRLEVAPPVRVRAVDAGAIEVTVKGRDRGVLGELGERGRRTFG